MKKYLLWIIVVLAMVETAFSQEVQLKDGLTLLKNRKDRDALVIFEKILITEPNNLDACWGKAEVLRRIHQYKAAEDLLNEILKKNPRHASSLISLAYLRYKDDRLNEAQKLIRQVLTNPGLDRENKALAYMMLGAINSRRSSRGWLLSKIRYGTHIEGYFLKAKELDPDFPEVYLGLGTFHLLAPPICGGNIDKAIEELEWAVKIAPDFATANARLAQAYKKKGDLVKYNFYIQRAIALDPENEVFKEIRNEKFRN